MTSRGTSSNHASPTITATAAPAAPSAYPIMAPGDHQRGVPPIVSPRTSSNRTTAFAATVSSAADRSSRRGGYTNESTNSPRIAQSGDGQQDRVDRQRSNGNTQINGADGRENDDGVAAANAAARARRRAQQAPPDQALPHRPSGSREPRQSSSAQRAAAATGTQSPSGLSREASEVLNRVIISKPEVDIERERERMAEAVPSSPTTQTTPGGLSVVGSEGVEDGGRGSRSRHDHGPSSSRKEKNSRFGEYFLGNTLGEGEFGKVKMGWKQEGGVQVSYLLQRAVEPTNIYLGCYQAHSP